MSNIDMTNYQKAVDLRGKNIVVSASAGCGKTTTMIKRITDVIIKHNLDITSLLVVTFTRAAALEMKLRLKEALSLYTGNEFLLAQLEKIELADISTIHSFCTKVCREFFNIADIPPDFKIMEDTQSYVYKTKALDELIEERYASDDNIFFELSQIFGNRTDDGLAKTIDKLYELSVNMPKGIDHFIDLVGVSCNDSLSENLLVRLFINDLCQAANEKKHQLTSYIIHCKNLGLDNLHQILSEISVELSSFDVNKCLNFNLTHLNQTLSKKLARYPTLKKADKNPDTVALNTLCKQLYDNIYLMLAKFKDTAADLYHTDTAHNLAVVKHYLLKLCELTKLYRDKYIKLKKEHSLLDFSDLEYYTYKILQDEGCQNILKDRYQHIFVDEFQDTNRIQDEIISSLNKLDNIFIVGDKKQSIYRFRGADSDIFWEKSQQPSFETIILNRNFRSDKNILEFVNNVFSPIMKNSFSKVNYNLDGTLIGDREYPLSDNRPQIIIDVLDLDTSVKAETYQPKGVYSVKKHSQYLNEEQGQDDFIGEANLIACRIKQLINDKVKINCTPSELENRKKCGKDEYICYDDITILTRSKQKFTEGLFKCLQSHGIPVAAEFSFGLWNYKEVTLLIEYLKIIDNFQQDIPLVAVLKSPLAFFTDDELAMVRIKYKNIPYHWAIVKYIDEQNDELSLKLSRFYKKTLEYSKLSKSLSCPKLLLKIIEDSLYLEHLELFEGGEDYVFRVNTFLKIIFNNDEMQSVSQFLSFLEKAGDKIKLSPKTSAQSDKVHMCTVHSSKGLEYPIVFLAGCGNKFLFLDARNRLQVDRKFGLGLNFYDFESKISYPNFTSSILKSLQCDEEVREEINILYVAMTRAKYRLYFSGNYKTEKFSPIFGIYDIKKSQCYYDFVLNNVLSERNDFLALHYQNHSITARYEYNLFNSPPKDDYTLTEALAEDKFVYTLPLDDYKYIKSTGIALKNSVSSLNQRQDIADNQHPIQTLTFDEKDNVTTETGIAYHLVLEKIDYKYNLLQVTAFIETLFKNNTLNEEQYKMINASLVYNLLQCPAIQLAAKKNSYREVPFMASINAADAGHKTNDQILLQGVIDLLIIENDGATIIDFKFSKRSPQYLIQQYKKQLYYYRLATEQILGIKVKDCIIIQVPFAQQIDVAF